MGTVYEFLLEMQKRFEKSSVTQANKNATSVVDTNSTSMPTTDKNLNLEKNSQQANIAKGKYNE